MAGQLTLSCGLACCWHNSYPNTQSPLCHVGKDVVYTERKSSQDMYRSARTPPRESRDQKKSISGAENPIFFFFFLTTVISVISPDGCSDRRLTCAPCLLGAGSWQIQNTLFIPQGQFSFYGPPLHIVQLTQTDRGSSVHGIWGGKSALLLLLLSCAYRNKHGQR